MEAKHPIGQWTVIKTSDGHGVYEPGWGFVAIHSKSCHAHWNEGQELRRSLISAGPDMLLALREVLKTPGLQSGLQAMCAAAVAKALGKSIDDVVKGV